MPEEIVVRPARPGDVPSLARLSAPFVADDLLVARTVTQFHSRIGDYLTAVRGVRVVGCAGLTRTGNDLLLYNLCVAADLHGHGIGGRLLEQAETFALLGGCRFLLAASKYSGGWFACHGFTEVEPHRMPDAWADLLPRGRGSRLYQRAVARPQSTPPAFITTRQGAEHS